MNWSALVPGRGYIKAHENVSNPFGILGGPIRVRVSQPSGEPHVALPDYRELGQHICREVLHEHGRARSRVPHFRRVVTNHILHGISRIGTPLMPTEFTYVAFWGTGSVEKNGRVVDQPRMVHVMLTELVRFDDHKLATDPEVIPTKRQLHLIVAPFAPAGDHFEHKPVHTGFTLPDGSELPFWHVMFYNLQIQASRIADPADGLEPQH